MNEQFLRTNRKWAEPSHQLLVSIKNTFQSCKWTHANWFWTFKHLVNCSQQKKWRAIVRTGANVFRANSVLQLFRYISHIITKQFFGFFFSSSTLGFTFSRSTYGQTCSVQETFKKNLNLVWHVPPSCPNPVTWHSSASVLLAVGCR